MTILTYTYIVFAVLVWIVLGCCCAWLAREKGRDPVTWWIIGFLLGVVGLILLVGAPTKQSD